MNTYAAAHSEYHVEIDEYRAAADVLHRMEEEAFDVALDRAIRKTEDRVLLSLDCVNGVYRVRINEIVSIESQNHYLLIVLSSGETIRLRMRLSQMFEEIQMYPTFIKVGASYVINFNFVRSIAGRRREYECT